MSRHPLLHIRRADVLAIAALAGSFIVSAVMWSSLPARIPIHFDASGAANGFASRAVGAWLTPAIATGAWLLVRFGTAFLPVGNAGANAAGALASAGCALSVFLLAVHTAALRAAESGQLSRTFFPLLIGGLCLALAIFLPRIRRNAFVGIRTPWALTSDENWARTHRVASYTMLGAAVACFGAPLITPRLGIAVAAAAVVTGALVPAIYSAILARRSPT